MGKQKNKSNTGEIYPRVIGKVNTNHEVLAKLLLSKPVKSKVDLKAMAATFIKTSHKI